VRWASFAAATAGAFYLAMSLSVAIHEILGHGLMAVLVGGRFVQFTLLPGFGGYAWWDDVPDGWGPVVLAAGIAVNLLVGGVVLAFYRRPRRLSAGTAAAFLVGITNAGQGLGYTIQGAVMRAGDAAEISDEIGVPATVALVGVLALLLVGLGAFALAQVALWLEEALAPRSATERRWAFVAAVVAPLVLLTALRPHPGVLPRAGSTVFLALVFAATARWTTRPVRVDWPPSRASRIPMDDRAS
jgi:hypothetical protein